MTTRTKLRLGTWGASGSAALSCALPSRNSSYHPTSTCRIGEVLDPQLRVRGVDKLRVADASVMPNVISGNTNAACIMIGEKCAELLAREHGVKLTAACVL